MCTLRKDSDKAESLELQAKDYLPEGKILLPFQREAVSRMVEFLLNNKSHAVYNSCEMGLGKTVQALVTCSILHKLNPDRFLKQADVLIICPAVVVTTWEKAILDWAPYRTSCTKFTVLSYNKATTEINELTKKQWDVLILDEAHYVKSLKAKRTKAILKTLWPHCDHRICMSGTPFSKDAADGWTLFSRMAPHVKVFADWFSYMNSFCLIKQTPWGEKFYGVKNHEKLHKLMNDNFMVRYLKADVLPELPDKIFTKIILPHKEYGLAHIEKEFEDYKTLMKAALLGDEEFDLADLPRGPSFSSWKQMQGVTKAHAVIDYVKDLLEQNIPVILFGYHKEVLSLYREAFKKYRPAFIDGSTTQLNRELAIHDFQHGNTNLFIGQFKSAGISITLTRSSNVVLGELDYSPDTIAQAVDRAHRIGQKDSVTVHYFVVEDSIDERIAEMVLRKSKDFRRLLDGQKD